MDKFETLEDYQKSLKEFNERTRKSYENFIQEHGDDSQKLQLRCTPYTEKKGRYGVASLDFGFQIWQSRQSEFDAMTEALLNQTQLLAKQKVEVEEKDKRIQSIIQCIKENQYSTLRNKQLVVNVDDLERALRGEHE